MESKKCQMKPGIESSQNDETNPRQKTNKHATKVKRYATFVYICALKLFDICFHIILGTFFSGFLTYMHDLDTKDKK